MPVLLTNRQRRFPVDVARLIRHGEQALSLLKLPHGELSVLLVNDRAMRALNRDHRGINRSTDVLSFPMWEGDTGQVQAALAPAMKEGAPLPVGDIVISVETAIAQAGQFGLTPAQELSLLLVHGLVHLLGYDHELGPEESRRMGAEEARLLAVLLPSCTGLVARAEG